MIVIHVLLISSWYIFTWYQSKTGWTINFSGIVLTTRPTLMTVVVLFFFYPLLCHPCASGHPYVSMCRPILLRTSPSTLSQQPVGITQSSAKSPSSWPCLSHSFARCSGSYCIKIPMFSLGHQGRPRLAIVGCSSHARILRRAATDLLCFSISLHLAPLLNFSAFVPRSLL